MTCSGSHIAARGTFTLVARTTGPAVLAASAAVLTVPAALAAPILGDTPTTAVPAALCCPCNPATVFQQPLLLQQPLLP